MGRKKKTDIEGQELVEKRKSICFKLGISYGAYMSRLRNGWLEDEANICPRVGRTVRFYKGQSARSYILQHGGKLSTFNYWIKLLPLEEAIERTIHPKGRAKYFRDGLTLFEWCRKNHKNYYNEYKKEVLKINKL